MKTLTISTLSGESNITCGSGSFEAFTKRLENKNLYIVTDSNVYKLYTNFISLAFGNAPVYVIRAGESSKTTNTLIKILSDMHDKRLTRSSTVIALGGGVVGDIAGLAAALYMRGVHLIQVPTTLLAQVDSSVGGKTAVDFEGVKNMVGTFYQPEEVVIDPLFLKTLPRRELRCGLGEIVKYGALNADIYHKLMKNKGKLFTNAFLEDIVFECVTHKANVVCADERDISGIRKTLNLGHTTGHAFELWYGKKSHGEFVLIGMYYELYIASVKGVCGGQYLQNLLALIKKVAGEIPAYDDVVSAAPFAMFDKKNSSPAIISLVVPATEGQSEEIHLPVHEYIGLISACTDAIKEATW